VVLHEQHLVFFWKQFAEPRYLSPISFLFLFHFPLSPFPILLFIPYAGNPSSPYAGNPGSRFAMSAWGDADFNIAGGYILATDGIFYKI
jgi:hypothetical protein